MSTTVEDGSDFKQLVLELLDTDAKRATAERLVFAWRACCEQGEACRSLCDLAKYITGARAATAAPPPPDAPEA